MTQYQVVAHGLDYLRYKIFSDVDLEYIQRELDYLDVVEKKWHGSRFVDITGKQIEVIRLLGDINEISVALAVMYPLSRIDVFVDITGNVLDKVKSLGTVISNGGRVETIYSDLLTLRGDKAVFARAYDAKAAGHYESETTRFECEFKREHARAMLGSDGWTVNPVGVALRAFKVLFGIDIWVDDIQPIDFDAPRRQYEHDRERFYMRYGKGIQNDIEKMGLQGFALYVRECVQVANRGRNE